MVRGQSMLKWRQLARSNRWWIAAAAAFAVGIAVGVVMLDPALAGTHSSAPPPTAHGISTRLSACERSHPVCDPAAFKKLPMTGPDPADAVLLSRRQVLAEFARPGISVAAVRTTYGAVRASDPELAASDVIFGSRIVWVVTQYLSHPIIDQGADIPLGARLKRINKISYVIDAATGQETDYCLGCAAVPR